MIGNSIHFINTEATEYYPVRWALYAVYILMLLHSSSIVADSPHCDQGLKPIDGDLGYQWRADSKICEGLYEANISASLEIVSYLVGNIDFDPNTNDVLSITVADNLELSKNEISVRAVTLMGEAYYRMDTALVLLEPIDWRLDKVVSPTRLTAADLGVFGWIGSDLEKVFVPLRVDSKKKQLIDNRSMELLMRPTVDIDFISWRAWSENDDNLAGEGQIQQGAKAGWPFSIVIDRGPQSVLKVTVNAKEANSEEWVTIILRVLRTP